MVSLRSYKQMHRFLEVNTKPQFTASDIRRNTTLSPQVINKILKQLVEKGYIKEEGRKTNKKYTKIKNIDFDFLMSVA